MTVELTEPQKKWIAALRSGDFKQGRDLLCRNGKYCCLGVACEVLRQEAGLSKSVDSGGCVSYSEQHEVAPQDLVDLLKLQDDCGNEVAYPGPPLTELNDSGKTFAEIADLLETGAYFRPVEAT